MRELTRHQVAESAAAWGPHVRCQQAHRALEWQVDAFANSRCACKAHGAIAANLHKVRQGMKTCMTPKLLTLVCQGNFSESESRTTDSKVYRNVQETIMQPIHHLVTKCTAWP